MAPKVVIAGTGRAGTTLLVQILTDLGLDTGFERDHAIDESVHAGLERGIEAPDAPRIVKNPNLSRRLGSLLDAGAVEIEHVIIPVRDLDVAAASRVRNTRYGSDLHTFGGLIATSKATHQREALALVFNELLYTVARYDLPHTFLLFPRFAEDWQYTYDHLSFLDPSVSPERWKAAIEARVDLSIVREQPLTRSERIKTIGGTVYTQAIARPARGLRRALGRDPR
ncbi:MAG: hypothetical protein ACXVIM_02545 [Acidimicrobiia bacterium]